MCGHLEKQDEFLMDAYRSMSHELHKLQVEGEMLMRAFYDLMAAQGLATKNYFLKPSTKEATELATESLHGILHTPSAVAKIS
ncbi:hypothetical protein OSB04_008440, partial [Centaurea solstitialis]